MSLLLATAALVWTVTDYKDPISDRMQHTASLEYAGTGLHVICVPKGGRNRAKSFIEVSTGKHLGFDGAAEVYYRFDDRPADFDLWHFEGKSVSTDLPDKFLSAAKGAGKLTLRIVDFQRQPYDIIFNLPVDFSPVDRIISRCQ